MSHNPCENPEYQEWLTGIYEYQGQVTTPRGDLKSVYECGDCGHEVKIA